jgi:hypothetical protein
MMLKRHELVKKMFSRLRAEDIVPGKVYLYANRIPVQIRCTESPGWKRGFVYVHNSVAFAETVGRNGTINIPLKCDGSDFWFEKIIGEVTQEWLDHSRRSLEMQISSLEKEMQVQILVEQLYKEQHV